MAAPEPLGDEDVERLADHLVPRVAEDLLGPLVEDQDALRFVDRDDRVGGNVEDGAEDPVRVEPRRFRGRNARGV